MTAANELSLPARNASVLVLGPWRPGAGQGEFAILRRMPVEVVDFYEKQPLAPVEYAQAATENIA